MNNPSDIKKRIKPKDKLGFIGLGRMGSPMAQNLINAGIPLIVYDIDKKALQKLVKLGASSGTSPAMVASQVNTLFLCLPSSTQVETVLFGESGVMSGANPNLSIVDTSTINVSDAQTFQKRLTKVKIMYNDCPISGMPFRAKEGSLTMMFGGSDSEYKEIYPYLKTLGGFVVHCGPSGTGQMMKAFNNIIYNINISGICEILPIAIKAGLDPEALESVFTTASSKSFASEYFLPRILDRHFDSDFSMEEAYKDIINLQQIAIQLNASVPVTNGMISSYQNAIAMGLGREPKSAMVKVYERIIGITAQRRKSP